MIRCILALHNLIDNKEQRLWKERQAASKAHAKEAVQEAAKDSAKDSSKDGASKEQQGSA